MKIIVATHNMDKLREIERIFDSSNLELISTAAYPDLEPVEEDGDTLAANALLKARHVHAETGLPAIADDTGLEVDTLDGAPGVLSARFAAPDATYQDNVIHLLKELEGVQDQQRTARFRTCAVYVDDTKYFLTEGMVEGKIISTPKGRHGFGYDPVFLVEETELTFGEMTISEKQKISHRARAFVALRDKLVKAFILNLDEETTA